MCISVYPKFLAREGTCKGDARCGMHAVPRVTSVNPGACKYNQRKMNHGGDLLSIRTRTSERGTGTTSARIPWFISESRKACVCPEETVYTLSRAVSLCLF
jgi:hypothetical protein